MYRQDLNERKANETTKPKVDSQFGLGGLFALVTTCCVVCAILSALGVSLIDAVTGLLIIGGICGVLVLIIGAIQAANDKWMYRR